MLSAGKVVIIPKALITEPTRATLRYEYFRMRGPTNKPESTLLTHTEQLKLV
jgi:hypothetical protein